MLGRKGSVPSVVASVSYWWVTCSIWGGEERGWKLKACAQCRKGRGDDSRVLWKRVLHYIISFSVAGFIEAAACQRSSLFQSVTVSAVFAVVSSYFSFTVRAQLLLVPVCALIRTLIYIIQRGFTLVTERQNHFCAMSVITFIQYRFLCNVFIASVLRFIPNPCYDV